jgi:hypothetical protein
MSNEQASEAFLSQESIGKRLAVNMSIDARVRAFQDHVVRNTHLLGSPA